MTVAEVAVPRGPRQVLSYRVPDALAPSVGVGCRVLVPLGAGNRRRTAYVVAVRAREDADPLLKPILDLLDERPLFDANMLTLFRFLADYYRASLGDAIRCGLPAGLNVADARVAVLTELGRARAILDPVLGRLLGGERPALRLGVPAAAVLRLAADGLIELRYALERPAVSAQWEPVVSATHAPLEGRLVADGGPARVLALVTAEGPMATSELKERLPGVGAAVRRLVQLGAVCVERRQVFRDPWRGDTQAADQPPPLTTHQAAAVRRIIDAGGTNSYAGFLLRGVTGSGKTEVYLHAVAETLERGRGAIVLLPEIALTPQLAGRFRARFGDRVALLHSALSDGERLDQWELIRRGERPCVVGARSALFAPLPALGLIVVDEEHEPSFKQDESPRYNARDLALKRGHAAGCPVVLGSATPALETEANARRGRLGLLELPERIGARPMPTVELVDMREADVCRPFVSEALAQGLREVVRRGEQAIVFLNRRGFAQRLLCTGCGVVPECGSCSIALTYHRADRRLRCHYCGFGARIPAACPRCGAPGLQLLGLGTEQAEGVLAELIPEARVARMDRDTTRGRALDGLLQRFRDRKIDILVGTQMVAKGHDFPRVTLVGVLLADQLLSIPDFRAAERTFQLLTQVAGRAGRADRPGRVLIQTYLPDHYSIECALHHDADAFWEQEAPRRERGGYPPFGHLVLLRVDGPDPTAVEDGARGLSRHIREARLPPALRQVGPTRAVLERLRGRTRWQLLLKSPDRAALRTALSAVEAWTVPAGLRLAVDVDPVNML